jgi:glyoxylase-like metal-dependent hydrolase (beta-lactamase superfamily II)
MRDMLQWTYLANLGKKVKTACYVWYIEGSEPKIIVDAGASVEHFTDPNFPMTENVTLDEGFKKINLKPEDIEIVILTHLHFDHVALAHRYKNARFIVQKREIEYASNPHIIDKRFYKPEYWKNLDLKIIEGDKEIIPGVKVLLTPGHSPGGQSTEIDTEKGKAIITGFCSQKSTFEITPDLKKLGWEVYPVGLHDDCREIYDSEVRVKKRADILIPNHDPSFIDVDKIP